MLKYGGFTLVEMLLALFIAGLVSVGLFNTVGTVERLYAHQQAMLGFQRHMLFLNQFIREKLHAAGDWHCLKSPVSQDGLRVQRYSASDAKEKWGIHILPDTDLLRFSECVSYQRRIQFLPISMFAAKTARRNKMGHTVTSLYIQFSNHRREELLSNVKNFKVTITDAQNALHQVVRIDYLLFNAHYRVRANRSFWYDNAYYTPKDNALYQAGEIDVAVRKASP